MSPEGVGLSIHILKKLVKPSFYQNNHCFFAEILWPSSNLCTSLLSSCRASLRCLYYRRFLSLFRMFARFFHSGMHSLQIHRFGISNTLRHFKWADLKLHSRHTALVLSCPIPFFLLQISQSAQKKWFGWSSFTAAGIRLWTTPITYLIRKGSSNSHSYG